MKLEPIDTTDRYHHKKKPTHLIIFIDSILK